MASPHLMLSDAEVHGLVDGHLEADKRAEVLRRLATSPIDRQRVVSWQDQNELIRAAFAGVGNEPLPISLSLATPPVQAVATGVAPMTLEAPGSSFRARNVAGFASLLIVLTGLGCLWLMLDPAERSEPRSGLSLRSSIDDPLAYRADSALDKEVMSSPRIATALPTTEIPDLGIAGFAFDSAEASTSEPPTLLFHYRNASAERVVIGVTRVTRSSPEPTQSGRTYSWRQNGKSYAIAGTVAAEKLRVIAGLLQDGSEGATRP